MSTDLLARLPARFTLAAALACLGFAVSAASAQTIVPLGSGFSQPHGVAVDRDGNVFVGDFGNDATKEILAADGYATVKSLGGSIGESPEVVAVDSHGNLFIGDGNHGVVEEVLAVGEIGRAHV